MQAAGCCVMARKTVLYKVMRGAPSAQRGFTIPELLVAIALVIVLGGLSIFLLRTNDVDAQIRTAQRKYDVALIVQAVNAYRSDHGALPDGITTDFQAIASDELDLCGALVPTYLSDIPYDPSEGMVTQDGECDANDQQYSTGYSIKKNADGTEVNVVATHSEDGDVISLTKKYE